MRLTTTDWENVPAAQPTVAWPSPEVTEPAVETAGGAGGGVIGGGVTGGAAVPVAATTGPST